VNVLRRLSLSRLLLLCVVVVVVGIGATALALAVGSGPTPPPKPLADAIHDGLSAPKSSGVTARIQLTNHLLEGASLAGDGGEASQLSSSPLISGASGRLWVASDGHARLELQSEKGDMQILWDGKTAEMYDASTNTLYRYTPKHESGEETSTTTSTKGSVKLEYQDTTHKIPTVAEIEERIADASKHVDISGATPTDVAGQAAYTVRVAPRENGGLIAGAELSWDADHGNPLRAAVYSTTSSAPVIELAASEISYGQPDGSALEFSPPANAKVQEVTLPNTTTRSSSSTGGQDKPHVTVHGKGLGAIVLAESPVKAGSEESGVAQLEGLQQVDINGTNASELPTQLGTLLSFERAGVRYLLVGSITPSAIEAFARGI
jgi:outer membrane lipoprotein-sorting protein